MSLVETWTEAVPTWWTASWIFLLGLIVGSFLNVVVHRVPRGLSIVTPRSRCPRCDRAIRWYENVPVASWLALRGRCAGCGCGIAWRYPAIELLTGLLFLAAFLRFDLGPTLLAALPFLAATVALVAIDAELFLLPDAITLPATWLGLALSWWSELTTPASSLVGVLLAVAMIEGLNLSYRVLRGRDGLGAGDTKMLMMIGAFLGWDVMLVTLFFAAGLGVIVGVPLLALGRVRARRRDALGGALSGPGETVRAASDPETRDHVEEDGAPSPEPSPEPGLEPDLDGEAEAGGHLGAVLRGLVPERADELFAPLVGLVLLLSFLVPAMQPEHALAGTLVGAAIAFVHRRLAPRVGRAADVWALAGALVGSPSATSLVVAAVVVGASLLLRRPLDRRLRASGTSERDAPTGAHDESEEDAAFGAPETGPGLMEAALPLGVFLGLASVPALFWGVHAIDWYLEASRGLAG